MSMVNKNRGFLILWLCIECALIAGCCRNSEDDGQNSEGDSKENILDDKNGAESSENSERANNEEPVPTSELLEILDNICKLKGKKFDAERKRLRGHDKGDVITLLEFAITDDRYWECVSHIIRYDYPNERLTDVLVNEIWKRKGDRLLVLIDTAIAIANEEFLPCILERAIDSPYVSHTWYVEGHRRKPFYTAVYYVSARMLFKITKGEIGIENVDHSKNPICEEREVNIGKWKEWWDKNRNRFGK
jgi:hypothetical protein